MQNYWSAEKLKFVGVAAFGLLIGLITGYLAISLAIAFGAYSIWLLKEARRVEVWLARGAKRNQAPDTNGIIGHIEQQVYRQKQSARERKKRLKKIVGWYNRSASALPDATVITNNLYQIVWANDAAERLLGIIGSRDSDQRIDNLVRSPAFQEYLRRSRCRTPSGKDNDGSANSGDESGNEMEIPAPRNPHITLSVRSVAYAENLLLFSFRDVSARVRLRETRQAFVTNASHELKTPLTVIHGHLELLRENPELPEKVQQQIIAAAAQTRRMRDIVGDLLTLSKLENQELESSRLASLPVALIVNTIVSDIRSSQANRLEQQRNSFELELDESLLLSGSEGEIKSVCSNLLYNAVQHTPPGARVTVKWFSQTGGAALWVRDNGPGIAPEHLNHITERFYRVDTPRSRESGGTGLGLAIVKHIVSRHQGTFSVDSSAIAGTCFRAEFPASQVHRRSPDDEKIAASG